MASQWVRWFRGICVLAIVVLFVDWGYSTVRLGAVRMDLTLNPPKVVADGKQKTILTIRVTEDGHPRANDLLQLWLASGGGILQPQWVYTDKNGVAHAFYQPNPASPYDVVTNTAVTVEDTNLGHLIEVTKGDTVHITLVTPSQ